MATTAILRNARRVMKFLTDGPSYDNVMKNVREQLIRYSHSQASDYKLPQYCEFSRFILCTILDHIAYGSREV